MIPSALDSDQQSSVRVPLDLSQIHAEVQRSRPDLDPEDPEYRAAVLLLLIHDTGFNVDRLTMRTRFPREFVARCLRRLSDNGWWVDGADTCDWGESRASHEHFWLDVDVALARRLRRLTDGGERQWADLDGWVKEFEYAARNAQESEVYNEYRHIPPHDPGPVFVSSGEEDEEEEEGREPPVVHRSAAQPRPVPATSAPADRPAPVNVQWLGGSPDAEATPTPAFPLADVRLQEDWDEVEWLG